MLISEEQQQNITTHIAFEEVFNKKLAKQLFKPMDVQKLQEPKKISTILVKILNTIANKMIKTKSSMGDMKAKHASKPDISKLEKSETYRKGKVLPEGGYIDIYDSLVNNIEIEKTSY